jgi:DNA primase
MSNEFVELNSALDAHVVIGEYTEIKKNRICCPFHDDENPSMLINKNNTVFCFPCSKSWDLINYVAQVENIGQGEAASLLAKKYGHDLRIKIDPKLEQRKHAIMKGKAGLTPEHITYLKKRGIEAHAIEYFSLGGTDHYITYDENNKPVRVDKLCIFQPIFENRKPVFYNLRSLDGSVHRIEPGADKNMYVGNIDNILNATDPIVITEGYFDAIQAWQEGIPAVCTFGASLSEVQARKLLDRKDDFVLAYDNDEAGQAGALKAFRLLKKLSPGSTINFVKFPDGCKDLGEFLYNNDELGTISFYEWSKGVGLSYKERMITIKKFMSPLEQRRNLLDIASEQDSNLHEVKKEMEFICQQV